MKITLCVIGSRGDVQPTVALAKGLKRAGHSVSVFTHEMFEDLARAHGVDFVPLPGDPRESLIQTAVVELGSNPMRLVRWLREGFRPVLRDLFRQTLDALDGSDFVVSSSLSIAAFHVAERLGIPVVSAQLQPTTVTRAFPGAVVSPPPSWLPFKSFYNVLCTKAGNQTVFQMLRPLTNECRKDILHLPPLSAWYWWNVDAPDNDTPMIYAYSPAVLPRPSDWGPSKQVSGYWFLDEVEPYQPPDELAAFLDRGPPPVYVGTGSVVDHEREAMELLVIEAMDSAGQRAILHRGWSGFGGRDMPDSILVVDDVPHEWLFPRMAAVVHHGGAGTTAAGLRAGLPSVVVPFFLDQFLWAWRVHELGVGPTWIPRKRLTAKRLAAAVRTAVHDEGMRARARRIAERIGTEDGVARAVSIIQELADHGPSAGGESPGGHDETPVWLKGKISHSAGSRVAVGSGGRPSAPVHRPSGLLGLGTVRIPSLGFRRDPRAERSLVSRSGGRPLQPGLHGRHGALMEVRRPVGAHVRRERGVLPRPLVDDRTVRRA